MSTPDSAPTAPVEPRPRVMLLTTPTTYRASAFMSAAEGLGLDVVQALDLPEQLAEYWRVPLGVPFNDPERAVEAVVEYAGREPVLTILSLDDGAALIAAEASARLGLPHNSPDSALAARDKGVMRDRLREGGAPVPVFRVTHLVRSRRDRPRGGVPWCSGRCGSRAAEASCAPTTPSNSSSPSNGSSASCCSRTVR
ncbi:MAG: hypothetical protein WKH64_15460 [Chloroflexia bacterium]